MTTSPDDRSTDRQSPQRFDLAVIGSGGAAFAAAIRATTLRKSVVMIERGTLGGTCVNTGCVLQGAHRRGRGAPHCHRRVEVPGIGGAADPVDMPALIAGKQALVEAMRSEKYIDVADSYGWAIRHGDATFAGTPEAPSSRWLGWTEVSTSSRPSTT